MDWSNVEIDIVSIILVVMAIVWYREWAPLLKLNLSSRWSEDKKHLIVTVQFSNPSRLRLKNPKIYLQANEYTTLDSFPPDHYLKFTDPILIYPNPPKDDTKARYINPGETITVDRIVPCQEASCLVHYGLQYSKERKCREKWQQTTTAIAVKKSFARNHSRIRHSNDLDGEPTSS